MRLLLALMLAGIGIVGCVGTPPLTSYQDVQCCELRAPYKLADRGGVLACDPGLSFTTIAQGGRFVTLCTSCDLMALPLLGQPLACVKP